MTVPFASLGHTRADLFAARQVAFNNMMAASKDARAAWNRNDGAAQIAADIEYDAACQVLATIDKRIAELDRLCSVPTEELAAKLKAAEERAERYRHALAQILRHSDCPTAGHYAIAALFNADQVKGETL